MQVEHLKSTEIVTNNKHQAKIPLKDTMQVVEPICGVLLIGTFRRSGVGHMQTANYKIDKKAPLKILARPSDYCQRRERKTIGLLLENNSARVPSAALKYNPT